MPGLRPSNPSPYWSPGIAKQRALQDFLESSDLTMSHDYYSEPDARHNYLARANKFNQQASNTAYQSSINSIRNGSNFTSPDQGLDGGNLRLAAILRALRAQESGGNYGAVNSSSGALGAYQIMPSNLAGSGGWDQEALGRNISPQQFLQNAQLQNAIARYKFGNYMKKYGLKGSLSAWYSGDPSLWNNQDSQGNYPSIHDYVMQILRRLGRG